MRWMGFLVWGALFPVPGEHFSVQDDDPSCENFPGAHSRHVELVLAAAAEDHLPTRKEGISMQITMLHGTVKRVDSGGLLGRGP